MYRKRRNVKRRAVYRKKKAKVTVSKKTVRTLKKHAVGVTKDVFMENQYVNLFYNMATYNSSTTAFVTNTICLNGAEAPWANSTYQPRFWECLFGAEQIGSAPYQSYKVVGAKVTAIFYNNANNIGRIGLMALNGWNGGDPNVESLPSTMNEWDERGHGVTRTLGSRDGRGIITINKYFSIPKILGMTKTQFAGAEDTKGTWDKLPRNQVWLCLGAECHDASSWRLEYDLHIKFIIQCMDRRDVVTSNNGSQNVYDPYDDLDGASLAKITNTDLDARLKAIEDKLSTLGTS